jgi:hypothetical protein
MSKQQLDRAQVTGHPIDQGSLRSPHRVGAEGTWLKPDGSHPPANRPGILTRGEMRDVVESGREEMTGPRHLGLGTPRADRLPRQISDFELDRMTGLALRDRHAFTDDASDHEVRNLQADQIASTKLAVDCEIEQRKVAKIAGKLEAHADGPYVLGQERALLPEYAAFVPRDLGRNDGWKMDLGHGVLHPASPVHRRIVRRREGNMSVIPALTHIRT